jgi:transcriptional regulator of acetoin/glycerol metabolism
VIDKHGGNISKAAKELGLTRASLYRRLEKYGI